MPVLITPETFTARFPAWEVFCAVPDPDDPALPPQAEPAEVLEAEMDFAEAEFAEYVSLSEPEQLSPPLERHLDVIIRKRLFDLLHGDKEFESRPQILRDYDRTLLALERYRTGDLDLETPGVVPADPDAPGHVRMTARPRRFGGTHTEWFR